MITTEHLTIYPATQKQMETFILAETDSDLKEAYREMLEGCLQNPSKWDWYAMWMIELKDGRLFLTERGTDVSNLVMAEFLLD